MAHLLGAIFWESIRCTPEAALHFASPCCDCCVHDGNNNYYSYALLVSPRNECRLVTTLAAVNAVFFPSIIRRSRSSSISHQLGDAAEAARARALRLRRSAQDSEDAAKDEERAIETAKLQESRLQVQAAAMKAEAEAAAAAAEEEKAQREREEAAMAAKEALERARAAEEAAGAAKAAAIAAAEAARRATADAQALVHETEEDLAERDSLSDDELFVDPSKPKRLGQPETEAKKESQSGTVAMLDT